MIAADQPDRSGGRLLEVDVDGRMQHRERSELATLFLPGDVVVANDAATLPASLSGRHLASGRDLEVRLAAFVEPGDARRFVAIAFGPGDHRTPTEDRAAPPLLGPGDQLRLGPLLAVVEDTIGHPRLVRLRFEATRADLLSGLAHHGRAIQYAHVPTPLKLWDVWTNLAARPFAFESPSAGFALDWRTVVEWKRRGIDVVALSHAAGISSTGDPELDDRLPLDEPYVIPETTVRAIAAAKANGGRVIAIGTTVVRALEAAANERGAVLGGWGVASGRLGMESQLRIVDLVLTGMHEPGESHFELLRAFTDDPILHRAHRTATKRHYRNHEFGDSLLIERRKAA